MSRKQEAGSAVETLKHSRQTAKQQRSKPQIKDTKKGNKDTNRELQVRRWAQNLQEEGHANEEEEEQTTAMSQQKTTTHTHTQINDPAAEQEVSVTGLGAGLH